MPFIFPLSTSNSQSPDGFSPQKCTDMNGQLVNPADKISELLTGSNVDTVFFGLLILTCSMNVYIKVCILTDCSYFTSSLYVSRRFH